MKDTIEMAREARRQTAESLPPNTFDIDLFHERFVELVRAEEREACAEVCEKIGNKLNGLGWKHGSLAEDCAAAIRARSNT